jgi:IS30 family transposase
MHSTTPHYRQLQPEDLMTLASLQQQNYSVREISRVLQRSASTIIHPSIKDNKSQRGVQVGLRINV